MEPDYEGVQQRAAVAYYNAFVSLEKADHALTVASRAKVNAQQALWSVAKAFVEAAVVVMDPPTADGHARTRSNSYLIEDSIVSNYGGHAECREMFRLNP